MFIKRLIILIALVATMTLSYASDSKVYYSASGKKYHKTAACRSLARSKNVKEGSLAEAEKLGLTPCKICYKDK